MPPVAALATMLYGLPVTPALAAVPLLVCVTLPMDSLLTRPLLVKPLKVGAWP